MLELALDILTLAEERQALEGPQLGTPFDVSAPPLERVSAHAADRRESAAHRAQGSGEKSIGVGFVSAVDLGE